MDLIGQGRDNWEEFEDRYHRQHDELAEVDLYDDRTEDVQTALYSEGLSDYVLQSPPVGWRPGMEDPDFVDEMDLPQYIAWCRKYNPGRLDDEREEDGDSYDAEAAARRRLEDDDEEEDSDSSDEGGGECHGPSVG